MNKKRNISIFILLLVCTLGKSQISEKNISFSFAAWALEDAIVELSNTYDIHFVYSPDKIPVKQTITAGIENASLLIALDELLANVAVKYVVVGERVVLKPDRLKKLRDFTSYEVPLPKDETVVVRSPIVEDSIAIKEEIGSAVSKTDTTVVRVPIELLAKDKIQHIRGSGGNSVRIPPIDLSFLDDLENAKGTMRAAQVSIAPGVSSNFKGAKEMTNRFSLNTTWGLNGGVNGGEIGILGNTVKGNMQGIQIAGLINIVKGNVIGTQVAGLTNISKENVSGAQITGLANRADSGNGVQVAGLWNIVRNNYVGVQFAGWFNVTRGKNFGWQISPIFNMAGDGLTQVQISGLINEAHEVRIAQIGVINHAYKAYGIQLGLINVAEASSGTSIGLLNFIKHGYNRLELSKSDLFQWNAAYKFGSNGFYNIIQTSLHSESEIIKKGKDDWSEDNISWGLGYGIGTSVRLGEKKRWRTNIEAVVLHINEKSRWSNDQNWFGQARWTLSWRLFRKMEIFGGGTVNASLSNIKDAETGDIIGSQLPQNVFFEDSDSKSNIKLWWGWTGGVRF